MRWLLLVAVIGCAQHGPALCPSPLHPPATSDFQPLLVADTNQIYLYAGDELWRRSFGSCGGWQLLTPPSTPGALPGYAAAFDDARARILYIRGGDVWALDTHRLTFTKLLTVGSAPLGNDGVAAYDRMSDRVVFLGALTNVLDFSRSDQGAWSALAASPVTQLAAGAVDPTRQTLLVLDGGNLHAFAFLTQSWHDVMLGGSAPSGSPVLTWDATRTRMLAVGDGVWSLALDGNATTGSFTRLATTGDPPPRARLGAVADGDLLWLFGGSNGSCSFDDEWQLDLGTNAWANLHPATACP